MLISRSAFQGKLAGSEKLRDQDFTVNVSNSEAIFTGTARNAGSKGAVTRIGQSCGAVKVVNNISAPAIPRPAKPIHKGRGTNQSLGRGADRSLTIYRDGDSIITVDESPMG
jgi:hypothetical protein